MMTLTVTLQIKAGERRVHDLCTAGMTENRKTPQDTSNNHQKALKTVGLFFNFRALYSHIIQDVQENRRTLQDTYR